jgi:hypothetical protein
MSRCGTVSVRWRRRRDERRLVRISNRGVGRMGALTGIEVKHNRRYGADCAEALGPPETATEIAAPHQNEGPHLAAGLRARTSANRSGARGKNDVPGSQRLEQGQGTIRIPKRFGSDVVRSHSPQHDYLRWRGSCQDYPAARLKRRGSSGPEQMACGSKEFDTPLFPFPPPGESRGGRVPPTPEARCTASKKRWRASCSRLPPQEGCRPLVYPLPGPDRFGRRPRGRSNRDSAQGRQRSEFN